MKVGDIISHDRLGRGVVTKLFIGKGNKKGTDEIIDCHMMKVKYDSDGQIRSCFQNCSLVTKLRSEN
jgi:hypothetical protein